MVPEGFEFVEIHCDLLVFCDQLDSLLEFGPKSFELVLLIFSNQIHSPIVLSSSSSTSTVQSVQEVAVLKQVAS